MSKHNRAGAFFDDVVDYIEGAQYSFVKFVGAILPWLTPLIPAALTYINARYILNWPAQMPLWMVSLLGIVAGLSVEGIGIVGLVEFSSAVNHNRRMKHAMRLKRDRDAVTIERWAVYLPGAIVVVYMAIIITINVWLHLQPDSLYAQALTFGGLSFLTLLSAAIITVQANRADISRTLRGQSGDTSDKNDALNAFDWRLFSKTLTLDEAHRLLRLGTGRLASEMGIPAKTAQRLVGQYLPDFIRYHSGETGGGGA